MGMVLGPDAPRQRLLGLNRSVPPGALDPASLSGLARGIATTRHEEIDCEGCYEQLDSFVETVMAGKNAAALMPLVQDHLFRCGDCREEYEVLLRAVRVVGA